MRLIDADKINFNEVFIGQSDFAKDTREAATRLISMQPTMMDWIPVGERLPKGDEMMLVTCQTKKGVLSVNRAYYSDGFWHGSGSMSGVIAWMPLPEPYWPEVLRETGADAGEYGDAPTLRPAT